MSEVSRINISVGRSTGETAEDAGYEVLLQLSTDNEAVAAAALRAAADSLERQGDGKR